MGIHGGPLLALVVLLSPLLLAGAAELVFLPPSYVGPAYFAAGFQGLEDGKHALGTIGSHMYATADAGHSWRKIPLHGSVMDAVRPPHDGMSLLSMGKANHVSEPRHRYNRFEADLTVKFTHEKGKWARPYVYNNVVFQGLPDTVTCADGRLAFGCPFRLGGNGWTKLPDDTLLMTVIVYWDGVHANPNPALRQHATSVLAFRSGDGLVWNYTGTIMDASSVPGSEEGPNENDVTVLSDGKTLMSVVRLDAGDGPTRQYAWYAKTYSSDLGRTWTPPITLPWGMGCARPRLLRLDGGPIIMTGGRKSGTNREVSLWLNLVGDGIHWEEYSISHWHNTLSQAAWHYTPDLNTSGFRQSTSYTSLVATGPTTGFVIYPQSKKGQQSRAYCMQFVVSGPAYFKKYDADEATPLARQVAALVQHAGGREAEDEAEGFHGPMLLHLMLLGLALQVTSLSLFCAAVEPPQCLTRRRQERRKEDRGRLRLVPRLVVQSSGAVTPL